MVLGAWYQGLWAACCWRNGPKTQVWWRTLSTCLCWLWREDELYKVQAHKKIQVWQTMEILSVLMLCIHTAAFQALYKYERTNFNQDSAIEDAEPYSNGFVSPSVHPHFDVTRQLKQFSFFILRGSRKEDIVGSIAQRSTSLGALADDIS